MKEYSRVTSSPYPKGSAEDIKLSQDQAAFAAHNRHTLGQGISDVVTGRALVAGAKVVGSAANKAGVSLWNGTIGNALKVEKRHQEITTPKK